MGSFDKCPGGHELPFKGPTGDCTPVRCSMTSRQRAARKETKGEKKVIVALPAKAVDALLKVDAPAPLAIDDDSDDRRQALAAKQYEKWRQFIGVKDDLQGDEAEKWSDAKLTNLLPVAVAQVESDLKYGSPEQRARAADKILNANGRGKRDPITASAPPIVINMVNGGDLPWRQASKVEVVEGSVKQGALPSKSNTGNT